MDEEEEEEEEEETQCLSSSQLLQVAEHHLRLRNYSLSSQYALESLHSSSDSPLRRRSSLIVAVSDVLFAASQTLGSSTNWYSVLGVDTFCADLDSIRSKFKSLHLLFDPLRAKFPIADEAMKSAWSAWMVLSNPDKKSELDADLSQALAATQQRSGGDSFWTCCPYCYCIYEYAGVYEGFCLRCQNANCRRAFHGASVSTSPPPGFNHFGCFGCFPLGFSQLQVGSNSPFVFMSPTQAPTCYGGDEQAQSRNALPRMTGAKMMKRKSVGGKMTKRKSVGVNRGKMSQLFKKTDLGDARGTRYEYCDDDDDDDADADDEADDDESGPESAQQEGKRDADEYGVDADVEFFEKDGEIFVQLHPDE